MAVTCEDPGLRNRLSGARILLAVGHDGDSVINVQLFGSSGDLVLSADGGKNTAAGSTASLLPQDPPQHSRVIVSHDTGTVSNALVSSAIRPSPDTATDPGNPSSAVATQQNVELKKISSILKRVASSADVADNHCLSAEDSNATAGERDSAGKLYRGVDNRSAVTSQQLAMTSSVLAPGSLRSAHHWAHSSDLAWDEDDEEEDEDTPEEEMFELVPTLPVILERSDSDDFTAGSTHSS